ncbi:hypothetical protein [Breoghania sp.]|uniref:hypothetical protein n=1 Tax=Breoghania sp. TaxID=2065378 RepID=UPI0029CA9612|nr:hypothetical protein [Breoghania sp.]
MNAKKRQWPPGAFAALGADRPGSLEELDAAMLRLLTNLRLRKCHRAAVVATIPSERVERCCPACLHRFRDVFGSGSPAPMTSNNGTRKNRRMNISVKASSKDQAEIK